MARKNPIFFGWYIVGVMVIAMTLAYGTRSSFSSFFPYVLGTFHWDRGVTAIMLSLNLLVYGLSAPIAGMLIDKWKPRWVVVIGIFILGFSTAACYFADQLWQYYLLFGVGVPLGTALCGSPVFNAALLNWFHKRRGLAMGLGQIGGGLSMVYIMLIDWVNTNWGWHYSFIVMGALVIAVMLPLYLIFYYAHPRDKKIQAYGAEEVEIARLKIEKVNEPEWTLRRAFRTYQLWLLIFADFCFWGLGNYLVIAHQIKFAEDAGFTSLQASGIFALFGLVSIAGQICAFISDTIGREKAGTIAVVMSVIGLISLMSVRDTSQMGMLYIYAICSGFATGLFSPTVIVSAADLFHGKNIGAISALVLTGVGLGGAIGPWLGGFVYDRTGSYMVAFSISMVAITLSGVSFWFAAPRHADKLRAKMLKRYG
jgi:MFS family permease